MADFTHQYNTPIPPEKQKAFDSWLQKTGRVKDYYDYDIQGAWLNGAGQDPRGHFPDTFKKPNHPTFSNESQYSSPENPGGSWHGDDFVASPANLIHHTPDSLHAYFQQVEPNSKLYLPPQAPGPAQPPQPQMQQSNPLMGLIQHLLGH